VWAAGGRWVEKIRRGGKKKRERKNQKGGKREGKLDILQPQYSR
jgi:hypothetical protein